ncbi:MAG: DNA topoisomerase III [Firmicutes bacterium]|nr:DNA topoisomerase III [Bacillota bacterium]
MAKTLVLAEKPSVGRDLARVLGCQGKDKGYLENDKYIITWALGHLVTLAEPEAYNEKYKSWRLEDLPMLPDRLKLVVIKQTGRQYNTVKKLMQQSDVKEIVIATDAGREGELVARWILEKANIRKQLKRLWISSVTDKAIKTGFSNLRSGADYENLYASAVARAEADWLVGINATRALTCKFNAQLSCGRVQTPTLAIIAAREEEIKNFKPQTYYGITAEAESFNLTWQDSKTKNNRTFDKAKCNQILAKLTEKVALIIEVKKSLKKKPAPLLYNLTELQRDANRIFSFSAKETLSIMQGLYENHKVLTYPRTDSRYITTDMIDTLKERVRACATEPYRSLTRPLSNKTLTASKTFVDDNKVSDHHAIIPTEQPAPSRDLSFKEKQIYDLVVKRFLAVLYPPFEYEQTTVTAIIGNENFSARGKIVLNQGWKEVYANNFENDEDTAEDERQAEQTLPKLKEGDQVKVLNIKQTRGETSPPPRFDEGSLLAAMENPVKYMAGDDKNLIKSISKSGGLGTVATRADIIEKLFNTFLIEKNGSNIHLTSKGRQLLELVPADLKSPALTGEWEMKLEAISKGELKKEAFVSEMRQYANKVVREIKSSGQEFKHDNLTRTKCPQCDKYLLEVKAKKGKMLVCPDRDCGYRNLTSQITNARCPQCRKKLELHGSGDGRVFICRCGYREKLSAFEARRKKDGNSVSKKDVSNYMKKQKHKSDGLMNTALADALSKLKK